MLAQPTSAITKRFFQGFLRCAKLMWWMWHEPDAPEIQPSVSERIRMRQGKTVGELARDYFPGGYLIPKSDRDLNETLIETAKAIHSDAPAIYEGAFCVNNALVFVDILLRTGSSWTLIEVKSATSLSEDHITDVAFQAYVLKTLGIEISTVEVMHLNRECKYPDLDTLFVRVDVTDRVLELLPIIHNSLPTIQTTLEGSLPHLSIGEQCTEPNDCPFKSRCWPQLPEHHISTLYGIRKQKVKEYIASGYQTIPDLPDSVKLSPIADRQRKAVKSNKLIIEREALASALGQLSYPIAHLDFETVQLAIPRWHGCRPYDQIPVQMSCHVVTLDRTVTHHTWLIDGDKDPRHSLAHAILDVCRNAKTVTAYYARFEQDRIRELADACPELAMELNQLADSIVDLLPIVRNHIYHPAFSGSFSLKKVLPSLVQNLDYSDLDIREGETASAELLRLLFEMSTMDPKELENLRKALLAYCERDTFAMVMLMDQLSRLSQGMEQ